MPELVRGFMAVEPGIFQGFHSFSGCHGSMPYIRPGCPHQDIESLHCMPSRYLYFMDDIFSLKDIDMINRLGSLKLGFYSLVALILLMGTGAFISPHFKNEFTMMNNTHFTDVLMHVLENAPSLRVWIVLLFICAGFVFINSLCCIITRQIPMIKRPELKNWFFFILHCSFVLVLICHGLILVEGKKQTGIILDRGQHVDFGRYRIIVPDIEFKDNIDILRVPKEKRHKLMTVKNIHINDNYAQIIMSENSLQVAAGKIKMLSALRYKNIQVTLTDFIPDTRGNKVRIKISITKTRLTALFFTAYALMIITLAGFTILTWKRTG